MIAMVALAAAPAARSVAEAERAFAAMAQARGQWTAFRAYMAPGAFRLTPAPEPPAPTPAAPQLTGLADPPHAIRWQPERTVTACDGSLAFSTGPWRLGAGSGHFYTIWQRQPDGGWKWLFEGGSADPGPAARSAGRLEQLRAECGRPILWVPPPAKVAGGSARDGTLVWGIYPAPPPGGQYLRVRYRAAGRWVVAAEVPLQ